MESMEPMEPMEPESADFDANFGALELEDSTTSSLSATQAETKPVHEGVQKQADPTGSMKFQWVRIILF